MLDKLRLNPNRMVAVIGRLRTIVLHIQLQVPVIAKTIYPQNLTNAPAENLACLLWHRLLNQRWHSQHTHSVSNFE